MHSWLHSARGGGYPTRKWNVHSLCLAKLLDIESGSTGFDNFVKRLKKKVPRPACCEGAQKINVDDQHGNNVLSLCRHRFGRKVNSSDRRVFHEPSLDIAKASQMEHYFSIGNEAHAPSDQIEIILNVTGEKGWSS